MAGPRSPFPIRYLDEAIGFLVPRSGPSSPRSFVPVLRPLVPSFLRSLFTDLSHYLGKNIAFVKSHIYLGVTLDNTMSMVPLLKNVKKRVSNKVFQLRKLRKFMTFKASYKPSV